MNSSAMDQMSCELKLFFQFCKENRLTDDEIRRICTPLSEKTKAGILKPIGNFKTTSVAVLLLVGILLCAWAYFDSLSWHISAIGRIALIQALPFWDWRNLKNEKCLLPNTFIRTENIKPTFDCALCESITKIYIEANIDSEFLKQHYLNLHNPVIVTNALKNWKNLSNNNFSNSYFDSVPCKLSTNVYNGLTSVGEILEKLQNFEKFFLHFQNCDFKAVKEFRTFTPKPHFLHVDTSPIQYSWLLINKNYDIDVFKTIELREPITLVGQANGSSFFKLIPRHNCQVECSILHIELMKGEALIFTSMWNLEYKPNGDGENYAVILEMH